MSNKISTFSVKLSDFPSSSPIQSQKSKSSWAVSRFRSFGSIVLYGSTLNRHLSADFSTIASPKLAASFPIAPVPTEDCCFFPHCCFFLHNRITEDCRFLLEMIVVRFLLEIALLFSRCKHKLEMHEEVKDESDVSIIAQYLDSVFRFSRCKHNCSDEENQIEMNASRTSSLGMTASELSERLLGSHNYCGSQ
ncbi:hypothetical protein LXL04_003772 [Taraxacum kok-saghyz]